MAMGMWVLTALGIKMCVYVDNDKEEREREKIESNTRKTKLLSDFVYLFVFT